MVSAIIKHPKNISDIYLPHNQLRQFLFKEVLYNEQINARIFYAIKYV
jgi:hypothetical protein